MTPEEYERRIEKRREAHRALGVIKELESSEDFQWFLEQMQGREEEALDQVGQCEDHDLPVARAVWKERRSMRGVLSDLESKFRKQAEANKDGEEDKPSLYGKPSEQY